MSRNTAVAMQNTVYTLSIEALQEIAQQLASVETKGYKFAKDAFLAANSEDQAKVIMEFSIRTDLTESQKKNLLDVFVKIPFAGINFGVLNSQLSNDHLQVIAEKSKDTLTSLTIKIPAGVATRFTQKPLNVFLTQCKNLTDLYLDNVDIGVLGARRSTLEFHPSKAVVLPDLKQLTLLNMANLKQIFLNFPKNSVESVKINQQECNHLKSLFFYESESMYYHNKDYTKALFEYNISESPEFAISRAKAYYNRANGEKDAGNALVDYNKAIEFGLRTPFVFYNRAEAKAALKKYEEAILDFDQAIALDPAYFLAFTKRGLNKRKLERHAEAVLDYDQAIALNPSDTDALNGRGISKDKLKRYDDAILDFNKTVLLKPDFYQAFNNRGITQLHLKNYSGAIDDFKEALRLNPGYASATEHLRIAEERLKPIELNQGIIDQNVPVKIPSCVKLNQTAANEFKISYSRIALGAALGVLGLAIMAVSIAGFVASCGASSGLSAGGVLLGKHVVAYAVWLLAGSAITAVGAVILNSAKKPDAPSPSAVSQSSLFPAVKQQAEEQKSSELDNGFGAEVETVFN